MINDMGLEGVFIPEFYGNKSLPADEQVEVVYKLPTTAMKRRLMPKPDFKFDYDPAGNVKGGSINVGTDLKPIIETMLVRIRHLAWRDEKKVEHQVTDAKSLYDAPVQYEPLEREIGNFFREQLQKELPEKN